MQSNLSPWHTGTHKHTLMHTYIHICGWICLMADLLHWQIFSHKHINSELCFQAGTKLHYWCFLGEEGYVFIFLCLSPHLRLLSTLVTCRICLLPIAALQQEDMHSVCSKQFIFNCSGHTHIILQKSHKFVIFCLHAYTAIWIFICVRQQHNIHFSTVYHTYFHMQQKLHVAYDIYCRYYASSTSRHTQLHSGKYLKYYMLW